LEALTARVDALTARVESLAAAQQRMEEVVQQLLVDVAALKGDSLERKFCESAPAYLGRRYRRGRVLSKQELVDALDEAVDQGRLDEAESDAILEEIRLADAVVRARDAEGEILLVAEVSAVVDRDDVARAVRRARVLERLGVRTRPGVAGRRFTEGAESLLAEGSIERWQLEGN
ncbi:MAG: hypothetical protein QJR14_06520, partial [Bacillota bacterium]|nr:hypothetical protein [Bacillota bacterium]